MIKNSSKFSKMDINKKFQETLALYQEGNLKEAADAIEKLIKISAQNADFLHLAALIKKSQNEIGRAEDYFRKSLSVIPQQPVVLSNLANLLKLTNRGPEANKFYKEACRILPNFFDAWFNRANLCIEMNDFKTAESCLIEAIKIKPNENTKTQLLSLYLKSAQYDELLTASKMFITNYSKSTQGYLYKARALKALGFDSDALDTLKEALGHVDAIAEIQHEIGLISYEFGDFDRAKDHLNKAIEEAPEYITAHRTLNELFFQSNDNNFLASYTSALKAFPTSEFLYHNLAAAQTSSGDIESAIQTLETALNRVGKTPNLQHGLGALHVRLKNYSKAQELFESALSQQPNNLRFLLDQVSLFLKRSNYDCQHILDHALKISRVNQESWAYQGLIWRLTGDERYHWLYDYKSLLKEFHLPLPSEESDTESFLNELNEYLGGLHVSHRQPLDQSVQGGTQTMGILFDDSNELIIDFKNALCECINEYIANLPKDSDHPFLSRIGDDYRFSGSWSVKLKAAGKHNNHVHPFGWLSCCSYISLPSISGDEGYIKFGETSLDLGKKEEVAHKIKPEVGKCVFFPSYFWHGTIPFTGEAPRVTIPCDIDPIRLMT